jgi:hypothetical protein
MKSVGKGVENEPLHTQNSTVPASLLPVLLELEP